MAAEQDSLGAGVHKMAAAGLMKMAELANGSSVVRSDLYNREELIDQFKNNPANYVVFAGKFLFLTLYD